MYWNSTHIYEGFWKNGLKHGRGRLYSSKGIHEGEYANDKANGEGIMYFSDGTVYKG